jgi:hypothetical protein
MPLEIGVLLVTTKDYMSYTFHIDPGHGWLEVSKEELSLFNIADKISSYSYKLGSKVFLEEDCDAGLFINALENKGIKFTYTTINSNSDSIIRTYKRY